VVFILPEPLPGDQGQDSAGFDGQLRTSALRIVAGLIGSQSRAADTPAIADPAQQAVISALTGLTGPRLAVQNGNPEQLGPFGRLLPGPGSPAAAAATRFAALPATAQHAWLVQHLPALRAGRISLAQLP
jgi:hypothetical protein